MKRDLENRGPRNRDRVREHNEVSNQRRKEQFVPQPGRSTATEAYSHPPFPDRANRDLVALRDDRDLSNRDRGREHERDSRYRDADSRKPSRHDEQKLRENKYRDLVRDKEFEETGSKKTRMRVIKPSEEAGLRFGRGFRSGRDRMKHNKLAADGNSHCRYKKRDAHWSDKKLEDMNERDWSMLLEEYNISFQGSNIPRPLWGGCWAHSKLNGALLKALDRRAVYRQPTPIQRAAIPPALEQRDVIGIAKPFSGKTAAFVLPMLTHISRLPRISEVNEAEGPYAVVMAPTSNLAQQIKYETIKLAFFSGIKVVSVVDGESIEEQGSGVGRGCEVIIATPSRLLDCLERGYVVLNQCICVVLDAADCMIDMGFESQVVGVLEAMPNSNLKPENEDAELDEKKIYRSTYMFSRTMPPALEQLARKYLRNPVVVTVRNPVYTAGATTNSITMNVVMMEECNKGYRLKSLLDELGDKTVMVFVNTEKNADSVAKRLDKVGYRVTPLHGGRKSPEEQREESGEDFRTKRCNVLVSTDFAQGGVDVPDVDHVINYDMPGNIEAYVHRIEQTYPVEKFGVVTTFLTLNDCNVFYAFKRLLLEHGSAVPRELARHEAANIIPDRPPVRWKDADCGVHKL